MLATLFLALAATAHPVQRFAASYPESKRIGSPDGRVLSHASGFVFESAARGMEAVARDFLSTYGSAFGVGPSQLLVLRQVPAAGQPGAVRFERTIGSVPVFGGDVVVGVDGRSRVFLVNTRDLPPLISGRHSLSEAGAIRSAVSSLSGAVRGTHPIRAAAGWQAFGETLRAVYRVDLVVEQPSGSWRIFVDAETGTPLLRESVRRSVTGNVFLVSPAENPDSLCPLSGASHTFCASPVNVTIPNLTTGNDLAGTQTTAFNCKGADFPTQLPSTSCTPVGLLALGGFAFPVDNTYQLATDDFSAAMAYFHLDKHVSFFKALDPTLPAGTSLALRKSIPAFVNARAGGSTLENAFFDPNLDAMVFGQGAHADFAYDATVMYHELTHAVVSAWGDFNLALDSKGALFEPAGLNEGTADSMAVAETGRSALGAFLGATLSPPAPSFRDMDDPEASRSCQGNGSQSRQFGLDGVINGLTGEEHADGEIWNGFYWEVFQGLKQAGVKGCGGACEAAPAIQYKALQLAAGTAPSFGSYWQTFKAAASALFPQRPSVAAYVGCVARRRNMQNCNRTVPLYANETKLELVRLRYSPYQIVIPFAPTSTTLTQIVVCSARGGPTTAYLRQGSPVQLTFDPQGNATVTADVSFSVPACLNSTPRTVTASGSWYLLFDLTSAFTATGPGEEIYRVTAPSTGVLPRPAAIPPAPCSAGPLAIATSAVSVPPRGRLALNAVGGSNAGYVFSFVANRSGGSVAASTGAYVAGPIGGVTDTIEVTDSDGDSVTRDVAVTAGVSISPGSGTVAPRGSIPFTASGGSGSGFVWTLATNASGGSINATTGAYTAGGSGGLDVVEVADSLGNTATANLTVSSPAGGGGCASGEAGAPACALLLAALLLRRGRTP